MRTQGLVALLMISAVRAVQAKGTTTRTATVFLDRDGLLVVDVTQSPPSPGHFAFHSVYRKQQAEQIFQKNHKH